MVKVMHKKMYYRQKAVVEEVKDPYTAIVRMLESGDKVKFDQAHLETVIPAIGRGTSCAGIALYKTVSTLHPKSIRIKSGLYPDWLDPNRMWIRSVHTAKFTLLKHVVMLVLLSNVFLHERGSSHSPVYDGSLARSSESEAP